MKHLITSILTTLPLLASSASAAVLADFQFEGNFNDSANHAGISSATIANGTAYSNDFGYSTYTTPVDGGSMSFFAIGAGVETPEVSTGDAFVTAKSQGSYLELTLTSATPMNLTSITLDAAKGSSSRNHRVLFTSDLTGDAFADRLTITNPPYDGSLENVLQSDQGSLDQAPAGTGSDWGAGMGTTISLSDPAFQGVTSATFRLYGFVINASSVSSSDVIRFDNVVVNGSVVPEPSTYALLAGAGVAALALWRRRK